MGISKICLIAAIFYKKPCLTLKTWYNQRQDTGKPTARRGRKAIGTHRVSQLQTPAESLALFLSCFAWEEKGYAP